MKKYTIVTDTEKLAQLESHIDNFLYFAFDTETTGVNVRKDKVIGLSVSGAIGEAYYLPLLTWDKTFHCLRPVWQRGVFEGILLKLARKELLMWNASFDVRIVKNDFGIDLAPSLLADVMLMKHTVEEEGEFSLKGVAIQLQSVLGMDMETAANEEQIRLKENVAANGGTTTKGNFEMYKADLEVMGEYACADADLTLRIAEHYKQKLEQEGLEEFFYDEEAMPLYTSVTIPMEERGIRLDLPKIHATRAALVEDMARLESSILGQLDALPEVQEWKRRKALELYPPKNKGAFAQAVCEYYELDLPKTAAGKYSLTEKNLKALRPFCATGFLLGTSNLPEEVSQFISLQLYAQNDGDKINILSKQQMGQIVFDCLGIKPLSKTDKGAPQFNDEMIQYLAEECKFPWAVDLSNYNKLSKNLGTNIDRFLEEQEDGIFYPNFFQHRTISGRFGSNIQQLPRPKEDGELDPIVLKYNNVIREFFISGEGRVFIDSDYESLEPHVFAHVSGDEGLRDIFRKGHDFYSTIAIATEKMQGVSADKKADNYLGKVNKPARQKSKAYSLGVPYGMTAFALGKTLGVSTEEAQELIDGYLDGFPNLKKWMEDSRYQAKHYGFVRSEAGRVRHLPRVKELYKKHGDQLLNFMYRKKLEARFGKDEVQNAYRDYKNGLNNSCNFQIQSLSASIVNKASIAITKEFKQKNIDGWIAANIHDQIIVNVPEDRVEECKEIVERCMKTTTKLSLELKAPPSVAKNWKDGH